MPVLRVFAANICGRHESRCLEVITQAREASRWQGKYSVVLGGIVVEFRIHLLANLVILVVGKRLRGRFDEQVAQRVQFFIIYKCIYLIISD